MPDGVTADRTPELRANIQKILGVWEGQVQPGEVRFNPDRTLIFEESQGVIHAKWGVTGRSLKRVDAAVESLSDGSVKITFEDPGASTVTLYLMRDGWLEGTMRGSFGNHMRVKLLKKS